MADRSEHSHRNASVLTRWALALLVGGLVSAQQPANSPSASNPSATDVGVRLFSEHIRPLFDQHCLACHSGSTKEGGLDLSTRDGLQTGGSRGPAAVPGHGKGSLLYKVITHAREPAMPFQGEKLAAETAALFALWIDLGAPYGPLASDTATTVTDASPDRDSPASADVFAKVRTTLETKCLNCHGGKFRQAGLDLSSREKLLRGSDEHGDIVIPGNPAGSLLVKKIKHQHEPGMPYQGEQLSGEEITKIVAWVEAEAPYSEELRFDASTEQKAFLHGSDHWAYQPPQRPPVPEVRNEAWVRNPIDAFLAAEHEKRNLQPMPEAGKRLLLRRLYLDLTGLPPTSDEIQTFLHDRSGKAYEKTVDRLLDSPQYGERWGRHWMDVWRYSDWYGLRVAGSVRSSQRHIWHWRDWIIESLNEDKGYDRMILEMLAGDELAPTDPKTLRATGYLVRSWFGANRNVWLRETVEHTAAAFLATTLKCARCHDHKFDPIAQEEYYRFRAFFEPHDVRTDRLPGQPNVLEAGMPRVFDSEPRDATRRGPAIYAQTYRFIQGDEKNPDKDNPLTPAVPEILGELGEAIEPVELPIEAYYPSIQPFVQQDLIEQARQEIRKAETALAEAKRDRALAEQRATAPQDEEALQAGRKTFATEVKPLFDKHCLVCHGLTLGRNEFHLISFDTLLEGGIKDGPGIIPGNSAKSPVIRRLRGETEPRMPSEAAPLPKSEIDRIARWIDGLQPEEPQVALRKVQEALALVEKKLAWREAALPAMEARVAADRARYADPPDPKAKDVAKAAQKAERAAELLKAEANLLEAQQKLADALRAPPSTNETLKNTREKRVTVATGQLSAAQEALGKAKNEYSPVGELYPKKSTGRRTALARWMTRKDNPLTARVAINHIWMRHFGEPLVASVDDFGVRVAPPTQPELFDWLAVEFTENNWSMKHIHRLMVTSSAYRMQSWPTGPNHPNLAIDSENRYFWRMNQRRMEAEMVRDSVLSVAGELDPTIGGPELDHYTGQRSRRRSLYFTHTPNESMVFLKLFNQADPFGCYRRYESIVPQQALALSNSEMSFTQSHLLARKLSDKVGDDANEFVANAFERILGREPSKEEEAESLKYLLQQARLLKDPKKLTRFEWGTPGEVPPSTDPSLRARESLVHVLFNRNEFVTIR